MQQISLLPSIFDLVPLTDISTPSRDSRDSETAAFEGILSTMMSSDKTAEQAGPRDEKAELDETPKDREPEPSREEDSSSRETDNEGSDSDEVREDDDTRSDENESGDENAESEKEQYDSNDETREDEEAQGNNDVTREDEEAQGNNDETREDEGTQGNNEQGETAEEGQESEEPVGEIEIAAAIDQAAALAGAVEDSGSGIEVVSMGSEAQQRDQGEVGEDAEQSATGSRQQMSEQPVLDDKIPIDKTVVRQDVEVPVEAVKVREGAPPDIKAANIIEKSTDASVVKEEPAQAPESKAMPEVSTGADIREPARETGRWYTEGILYVHEARVKNTRTDEIQTDEAFRADESTQSGFFKEAPSPVMPVMKDVEVQLSLDAHAQTSTNSGTDAPKSVESKESFEVISTEASGKTIENSGKTVQSGASRPASGRAFEIERSVANQVIRGTLSTLRSGKNEMLLQLRPPDLGNVRIRLTLDGDIMTARIVVATENVRSIVERQLDYLRTSLAEEGVKIGRFEVLVGQQYDKQASGNASSEGDQNLPGEGSLTSEGTSRHESETGGTQTNIDKVKSENTRVYIVA